MFRRETFENFRSLSGATLAIMRVEKKRVRVFRDNEGGATAKSGWTKKKKRNPTDASFDTNYFPPCECNDLQRAELFPGESQKKRKKRKNLNKESKREEEKYGEENKKKKIQAKHDRERTKKSVDQCQFWEELARRSNESFCNNYCRQIITALHVQSSRPHRQNSKRKE